MRLTCMETAYLTGGRWADASEEGGSESLQLNEDLNFINLLKLKIGIWLCLCHTKYLHYKYAMQQIVPVS